MFESSNHQRDGLTEADRCLAQLIIPSLFQHLEPPPADPIIIISKCHTNALTRFVVPTVMAQILRQTSIYDISCHLVHIESNAELCGDTRGASAFPMWKNMQISNPTAIVQSVQLTPLSTPQLTPVDTPPSRFQCQPFVVSPVSRSSSTCSSTSVMSSTFSERDDIGTALDFADFFDIDLSTCGTTDNSDDTATSGHCSQNAHSLSRAALLRHLAGKVYESYSVRDKSDTSLVVAPTSAHMSFSVYTLPTHGTPHFENLVQSRFRELQAGGILVVIFPVACDFFAKMVLPWLSKALLRLLALRRITSSECEDLSEAPKVVIPDFAEQCDIISNLLTDDQGIEGARGELVHKGLCTDEGLWSNWGHRWLAEEFDWYRSTLAKRNATANVLHSLMDQMGKKEDAHKHAEGELSMFIIKKSHPS